MPVGCDTEVTDLAKEAKRKAEEAKREKNLLDGLKSIQAITEASAVMSEEYYKEMFKRMDKADKEHKADDQAKNATDKKTTEDFKKLTSSQDNTNSTLKLLSIKVGTLSTVLQDGMKGMNGNSIAEVKDIAIRRDNLLKDLHSQRDDILIDMWVTQTDQLENIKDILIDSAVSNMEMMESMMGNIAKQLPEKSEITQQRREQQRQEMLMQAEREKDRAILIGIRDLLEDISKKEFSGGGGGGGGGGGLLSWLLNLGILFKNKLIGAFKWLKTKFIGFFKFLGRTAISAWAGIKNFAKGTWDATTKLARGAWDGIKNFGKSAWKVAKGAWGNITNLAKGAWGKITKFGRGAWRVAGTEGSKAWSFVKTVGGKLLGKGGWLARGVSGAARLALATPIGRVVTASVLTGAAIRSHLNKTTEILEEARKKGEEADKGMAGLQTTHRQRAKDVSSQLGDKLKSVFNIRTGDMDMEAFRKLSKEDREKVLFFLKSKRKESSTLGARIRNDIYDAEMRGDKTNVRVGKNLLQRGQKNIDKFTKAEKMFKQELENIKKDQQNIKKQKDPLMILPERRKQENIHSKKNEITKVNMKQQQQQQQKLEEDKKSLSLVEKQKEEKKDMQADELLVAIKDVAYNTKVTADKQEVNIITPPTTRPVNHKVKTMH